LPNLLPIKISRRKTNAYKLPLAGGLAGGTATLLLYPIDVVKSLCQNNPGMHVYDALMQTLSQIDRCYGGVIPATLGAIPSSAIYFGSYEYCKRILATHSNATISKPVQHMLAAATGNIISSAVFVPKDLLKHKIQAIKSRSVIIEGFSSKSNVNVFQLIGHIYRTSGVKGFYPAYRATLMKNIPSAVVRFTSEYILILKYY
jgi:solute carrier family 25 iron transporter 28/37